MYQERFLSGYLTFPLSVVVGHHTVSLSGIVAGSFKLNLDTKLIITNKQNLIKRN